MEIIPVSTSNSIAVAVCINDSPIFVCYPYLYKNPDIGTAVEYRKALLASLDVSTLDKPHLQLENLSRRFIHESNPDDEGTIFILYRRRRNYLIPALSHSLPHAHTPNVNDKYMMKDQSNKELFYGKIVSLDEIWEIVSFQVMYEHDGRKEMMQDLKIS
ncbi:hypothetical protein Tco_1407807 [Tanacetum coccineum]